MGKLLLLSEKSRFCWNGRTSEKRPCECHLWWYHKWMEKNETTQKPATVHNYCQNVGMLTDMMVNSVFTRCPKTAWRNITRRCSGICLVLPVSTCCLQKYLRKLEMLDFINFGECLADNYKQHASWGQQWKKSKSSRLLGHLYPHLTTGERKEHWLCFICSKKGKWQNTKYWYPDCDVGCCVIPCICTYHTELNSLQVLSHL